MVIKEIKGKRHYFDICGNEIHDGDYVLMDGCRQKVYLTVSDELGVDSTNPLWIEKGWATPTEYGIYPFSSADEPVLVP